MFEDGIIDQKEFDHIKSVMEGEDKKTTVQIEQSFHSPHARRHSKFAEKKARRFSHAKTEAPQHHHHHNESFSHADTVPATSPRRWSHHHHPVTHTQSFNLNKNTRKRASSLSPRARSRRGSSFSRLLVRTNSEPKDDSVIKSFSDPPLRKAKRVSSSDATPKKLLVRTPSISLESSNSDNLEGKTLRVTIHHVSEVPVSPKKDKGSSKSNKSRQYIARVKYGNEKKVTSKCKCQGHEAPKWANSEGMVSFKCSSQGEDNLSIEILRKRTILSDLVLGVSTLDLHSFFKSSENVLSQTHPVYVDGLVSSSQVSVTLELV